MKVILRPLLIAGIVLMMIVSCSKTASKPAVGNPADTSGMTTPGGGTSAPKTTDIYICGSDNGKPCYWKNDTEVLLPFTGATGGEALSIVVHGMDVYVAGYVGYGYKAGPGYWKNGVLQSLLPHTTGNTVSSGGYWATCSAFADTNYYVAIDQHWDTSFIKDDDYLKVGPSGFSTQFGIPDGGSAPVVNAMFASGSDVYLAGAGGKQTGQEGNSIITAFASYYKNPGTAGGGEHYLPTNLPLSQGYDFYFGQATGIAVSGSDIYACGWLESGLNDTPDWLQPGGNSPAYWKNDSVQLLLAPNGYVPEGTCSSIFLSGSDVYISGNIVLPDNNSSAGYWKNGAFTVVSEGAGANSIGLSPNGDLYLVGSSGYYGASNALVWKNGVQMVLATGGISNADQVFVYTH